MKNLVFYLIILSVASSCSKESLSFKIEGQLREANSEKTIPNAVVNLFYKEYKSGIINANYTLVGTSTTDNLGNYKFEIDRIKIYEIKIEIEDPKYYSVSNIYSSSNLDSENISYFNIDLEAKSWVTISLKNPFIATEEQMNIYKSKFKTDCESCCANGSSSFIEVGDTTFTCPVVGGSQVILDYGLKGSQAQYNEKIDCIPFDTAFIDINY
ncbi:MAG: hypothetical protein AB8B72_04285 [Crocinitomicaceae bacterium]